MILFSVLCGGVIFPGQSSAISKPGPRLLRDGFVIDGVEGELTGGGGEVWFFKFYTDLADDRGVIKAGRPIEALSCSMLEKMAAGIKKGSSATYRIWARVTRYQDRNFIFPVYYLPLSEAESVQKPAERQPHPEPSINEPDDLVVMPEDVMQMLKPKRSVTVARLTGPLDPQQDGILAGRTGFIVAETDSNSLTFRLDALGRNVQQRFFYLLPCAALQQAQAGQAVTADPLRLKVAGVLTRYKDKQYLLLQRATRLYNHGNFAR